MRILKSLLSYGLGTVVFALATFPTSAETPSHTYPPDYTQQYMKDCINTSLAEGLAEPDAQKLCDCTLAEFQQQYSLEAFKELNAKAETDETAANQLMEVGQLCFETILYE